MYLIYVHHLDQTVLDLIFFFFNGAAGPFEIIEMKMIDFGV